MAKSILVFNYTDKLFDLSLFNSRRRQHSYISSRVNFVVRATGYYEIVEERAAPDNVHAESDRKLQPPIPECEGGEEEVSQSLFDVNRNCV